MLRLVHSKAYQPYGREQPTMAPITDAPVKALTITKTENGFLIWETEGIDYMGPHSGLIPRRWSVQGGSDALARFLQSGKIVFF